MVTSELMGNHVDLSVGLASSLLFLLQLCDPKLHLVLLISDKLYNNLCSILDTLVTK